MSIRFHASTNSVRQGGISLSIDFDGGTTWLSLSREEAAALVAQVTRFVSTKCISCSVDTGPDEQNVCGLCGCGYFCDSCIGPHKPECEDEHR